MTRSSTDLTRGAARGFADAAGRAVEAAVATGAGVAGKGNTTERMSAPSSLSPLAASSSH